VHPVRDALLGLALIAGPLEAETAFVTCQNGEVVSVLDLSTGA